MRGEPLNRDHFCDCVYTGNLNTSGATGAAGAAASAGTPGRPGSSPYATPAGTFDYDRCLAVLAVSATKACFVLPQLRLSLHAAELAYQNLMQTEARDVFDWFRLLAEGQANLGSDTIASDPARALGTADDDAFALIAERATQLSLQAVRGLGYWGMPADYVPLVSLNYWGDRLGTLIVTLGKAEEAHRSFKKEWRDHHAATNAAETIIDANVASITIIRDQCEAKRSDIAAYDALISCLVGQEEEVKAQLQYAEDTFRLAIQAHNEAHGGGCDWEGTLKTASMIAGFATGLGSIGTLGTALEMASGLPVASTPREGIEQLKPVVGKIKEGVGGVREALDAYHAWKQYHAAEPLMLLPDADLDQLLRSYQQLPEAAGYRDLLRELVDTATEKNLAILARDDLASSFNALVTEIHERQQRVDDKRNEIAQGFDPTRVENALYMARAVEELKRDCVWMLSMEHRTLEFWTLRERKFEAVDYSSVSLANAHARVVTEVARELERRNQPDQRFDSSRPLRWTREKHPRMLDSLVRTGRVTLQLRPEDAFAGRWGVTVDEVSVVVAGAKTATGVLFIKLTHHGNGVTLDAANRKLSLTYRPRSVFVEYEIEPPNEVYTSGKLVDAEAGKSYLSPFGGWTIEVLPSRNEGLDLSDVSSIELRFRGFARVL